MFTRAFRTPQLPLGVQLPFHVLITGHWKVKTHKTFNRTLDEWVLLFCRKGSGELQLNGTKYKVKAGELFLCPPLEPHGYNADEEGWTIHWFHAVGNGLLPFTNQLKLSLQSPIMKVNNPEALENKFLQLYHSFSGPEASQIWEASNRLYDLLLHLLQSCHQQSDRDDLRGCFRHNDTRLEDIVERSGISRFHFCRRFKASFGKTPWEHLRELKVDEAKRRLLQETTPIKVISFELGFPNPDYFSRVFKKSTGRSPSQYRGNFELL